MTEIEIFAQIVGIVAMCLNVVSFQFKKQKILIFIQLLVSALFAVNMLLLGGMIGGILNILGILRALVFMFKDKLRSDRPIWLIGFIALYVSVYVFNFAFVVNDPSVVDYIVEMLPVIGMISLTVGFGLKDSSHTRKCALINSPAWLVYNVIIGTWGGIICEILTIISVILGMFRHDLSKEKQN
ncbi:MAG: YgjV family protein [Ruminococcaceae bacterium]|nr:YgjV family protein [Oscillospiraceae bacterium]